VLPFIIGRAPRKLSNFRFGPASMDVVVRSLEIQDAEPIRSALMSDDASTSRGRLELLSDDLIDSAMVAGNLECAGPNSG
jgi:hypothetical protein